MSKKIKMILILLTLAAVFSVFLICSARPVDENGNDDPSYNEWTQSRGNSGGGGGSSSDPGADDYNPCKWGCSDDPTAGKKKTDFEKKFSCYENNPGVFGTPLFK